MKFDFYDFFENLRHTIYFPFLVVFLISGLVCVTSLRQNNTTMIKLRQDVYAADKNNGDVNAALFKLRSYVYAHMNTNLSTGASVKPPIQLQYTYERLITNEQQKSSNATLYVDAKNYCEQKIPASVSFYGTGRISCVQDYILSHGGQQSLPNIPTGLYEFDFSSPSWSPDLAGWSLVVVIASAIGFTVAFVVSRFTKFRLP
jgi:hypothetical protein